MRWAVGLALAFGVVVLANVVMITLALTTPNPVVDSYIEAAR